MEPQYMMIGQAAGDTAWLSVKSGTTVDRISVPDLQKVLHEQGAILHLPECSEEGSEPPK
jgi:hypothetical protein